VQDVAEKHGERLARCGAGGAAVDRLCELNVVEQVANVCRTTVVRDAWQRGQKLAVHGWIYGLRDGLLCDLGMTVESATGLGAIRERALARFDCTGTVQPASP
jgi:carbonic anhydrase